MDTEKTTRKPPAAVPEDSRPETTQKQRDARVTPFDQSEAVDDLEITRRIRQAIVDEDRLSFRAKNVIVVTENGRVTLSGRVNSRTEADRIKEIATSIATNQVTDHLEVRE